MFITGATSGFGEAIAKQAAAAGFKLILTGRRGDRLEQIQHLLGDKVIKPSALMCAIAMQHVRLLSV